MTLLSTASIPEVVLFLAAIFGTFHHVVKLYWIRLSCVGTLSCADRTLCNIYLRQEAVRLLLALLIVYGAGWMMTRPPVIEDDTIWPAIWRYGLAGVILILNVESVLAWRDRERLGRTK